MTEQSEADATLRGLGYVRVVNELLEFFSIPHRVYLLEDIDYDVFVALYERLVGQSLLEVFGTSPNQSEQIANLQTIVDALASVLGAQLDHIKSDAIVVEKDRAAICNLVEIFEFAASLFPGTFTGELDFVKSRSASNNRARTDENELVSSDDAAIVEPLDRSALLRSRLLNFLTSNQEAFEQLERCRPGQQSRSTALFDPTNKRESRATNRNVLKSSRRPHSVDSNASRRTFTIDGSDDDHTGKSRQQSKVARTAIRPSPSARRVVSATANAKKQQSVPVGTAVTTRSAAVRTTLSRPGTTAGRPVSTGNGRVQPRTLAAASAKTRPSGSTQVRTRSAAANANANAMRTVTNVVDDMYTDRLRDFQHELALNLDARRAKVSEKASDYEALKRMSRAQTQPRATDPLRIAKQKPVTSRLTRASTQAQTQTQAQAPVRATRKTTVLRPERSIHFDDEQGELKEEEGSDKQFGDPWRLLEEDLPNLQVSSELVNRLYAKYVDLLQSASRQLQSASANRATKNRVRDAVDRYRRFLESVEVGLRNETRRAELVDARRMQIAQRNALTQKRIESIRLRRYFTDYYLRIRAEFARRKADFDETLFRRFFIQLISKYRGELASFVRSRRETLKQRADTAANANEARDAYYANEAQLALETFRSQKNTLEANDRLYRVELATLKRSLRDKMRTDIERMQDAVRLELGQVAEHFREGDVERILNY